MIIYHKFSSRKSFADSATASKLDKVVAIGVGGAQKKSMIDFTKIYKIGKPQLL